MQSSEIRKRYLDFFACREHAIVPSSSLVPENDPSVLFTTAGMQPLVPYLLGEKHPLGNRITDAQKCVRTQDIEEIGDNTHVTFFEMLGNWSFGDYFKKEAIEMCYEFLTSKEEGLGLDKNRIYVTVFAGNNDAPRDEESKEIWMSLGVPSEKIYYLEDNWWSPGDNGPCGPDTEVFYDVSENGLGDMTHEEFLQADERQDIVEIGNNVLIEYEKKDGVVVGKLEKKNIDFGGGLERQTMVAQGKRNVFDTDLFVPVMEYIKENAKDYDERGARIIADHIRTSVFMVADGVVPSNKDRGYILRRLIRRASVYAQKLGLTTSDLSTIAMMFGEQYKSVYPEVFESTGGENQIIIELRKFQETLLKGFKKFEKGIDPFVLATTYGFPIELTQELAKEKGIVVDREEFNEKMKKHQELSKSGSEQKFKGGLADTSEKTTMFHTATHLMLAGLRKYLGEDVFQAGSNITEERTRFDFTYPQKVEREILDKVEYYVNEVIQKKCKVKVEEMSKQSAKDMGVVGSFWEKYPEIVTVYAVECEDGIVYSRELCGGPHVENTGDIKGKFVIKKQESSSAGVRRVKAVLV